MWTSNGDRLTFTALKGLTQQLTTQALRNQVAPKTLVSSERSLFATAWSPEDGSLVYVDSPPTDISDIRLLSAQSDWQERKLIPPQTQSPALSPDGHWLAFAVLNGPRFQVVVQPIPEGPRQQVTADGGDRVVWSRTGRELFYVADNVMYAVPIDTTKGLVTGRPVRLFAGPYRFEFPIAGFDVTRDGRRFLMVKAGAEELAPRRTVVILNWTDELVRRVPARQ